MARRVGPAQLYPYCQHRNSFIMEIFRSTVLLEALCNSPVR